MSGKRWNDKEVNFIIANIQDDLETQYNKFTLEFGNERTYVAFREKRMHILRKYNIQDCRKRKSAKKNVWTVEENLFISEHITDKNDILYEKFEKKFKSGRSKKAIEMRKIWIKKGYVENCSSSTKSIKAKETASRERMIQLAKIHKRNYALKDFSFLVPGIEYLVRSTEAGAKWIEGKYLYMNEHSLYFRTRYGFIETLPRNRNLVMIKEKNTNQMICKHLNFDTKDRV